MVLQEGPEGHAVVPGGPRALEGAPPDGRGGWGRRRLNAPFAWCVKGKAAKQIVFFFTEVMFCLRGVLLVERDRDLDQFYTPTSFRTLLCGGDGS